MDSSLSEFCFRVLRRIFNTLHWWFKEKHSSSQSSNCVNKDGHHYIFVIRQSTSLNVFDLQTHIWLNYHDKPYTVTWWYMHTVILSTDSHIPLQAIVMAEITESASWIHYCSWKHVCWRYSRVQCLHLEYTNVMLILVWNGTTMFNASSGPSFPYYIYCYSLSLNELCKEIYEIILL